MLFKEKHSEHINISLETLFLSTCMWTPVNYVVVRTVILNLFVSHDIVSMLLIATVSLVFT